MQTLNETYGGHAVVRSSVQGDRETNAKNGGRRTVEGEKRVREILAGGNGFSDSPTTSLTPDLFTTPYPVSPLGPSRGFLP